MDRDYYPILKAAEIAKVDVEDLIHFGAIGKLPIYVFASGLPNYVTVFHTNSTKPFEIFSAETDTTGICKLPIVGLNKLSSDCLQNFELEPDNNLATFDYSGALKISPNETTIWVRPNPEVKLSIDKLFILHDDIKLLTSDSTSDTDITGCWRAFKIDQVCALNFDQANLGCRLLHRCG